MTDGNQVCTSSCLPVLITCHGPGQQPAAQSHMSKRERARASSSGECKSERKHEALKASGP